ncbi:MAG TPA: twin-arginine translocase TatA/TatE family subunit [Pyrinomonadaceae bacterium]|nr:twin-arginine translocase TatA/TatE family subunit [Pyrinomonadaceae bacterium]
MSEEQSAVQRNMLMTPTIASIMNLMGPDMMVILLIVLLLFGAKKLPELARGMGRAVKEFSAARDEIERGVTDSKSGKTTQPKLLSTNGDLPTVQ